MGKLNPRVDAYIAKSAEFAQPILAHVRTLVHEVCPDVEETIKWSMPVFVYAGGPLCSMAAFKQHASFGFWKHALVMGEDAPRDGMGSFGKLTSAKDLPAKKVLAAHIRKAMKLNEEGIKAPAPRKAAAPKAQQDVPEDLIAALKKSAKARKTFEAFSPSHKREYVEWILDAKRAETRARRIAQTIEWLAEGKSRNWKYETK